MLVHISSATTIGTRPGGQTSDEGTPPDPGWERNGYRASKVRAELVIQGWSESDGVRVPVIVPAWMWGPGDAAPTASGRLFLAVARGELGAVPRIGSQIVDARDVAAAAVLLEGNTQHLDSQRAERELGVTFRPLGHTITDEADWYRAHGTLPTPRRDDMNQYATKSRAT